MSLRHVPAYKPRGDGGFTAEKKIVEIVEFTHFTDFWTFDTSDLISRRKQHVHQVSVVVAVELDIVTAKTFEDK